MFAWIGFLCAEIIMPIYLTEHTNEDGKQVTGPRITADNWFHAVVRHEYAVTMGWLHETSFLLGELVEEIDES